MITNNKKSSMDMLRKMSILPVIMIAICAFSIKPVAIPDATSLSISESVLQDPWTPQNDLEERIVVVGFSPKSVSVKTQKDIQVFRDSERKIPAGVLSYSEVEKKPVFQESIENYKKYLLQRLSYPAKALEDGITGKVVVSYIIDNEGRVTDVKSPVRIDILSNEVERVIKSLPVWTPGSHHGKAVSVQCYIFVEFRLQQ